MVTRCFKGKLSYFTYRLYKNYNLSYKLTLLMKYVTFLQVE